MTNHFNFYEKYTNGPTKCGTLNTTDRHNPDNEVWWLEPFVNRLKVLTIIAKELIADSMNKELKQRYFD
jgi:hypothetical protein